MHPTVPTGVHRRAKGGTARAWVAAASSHRQPVQRSPGGHQGSLLVFSTSSGLIPPLPPVPRTEEPTAFPDLDMDASLAFLEVCNTDFSESDIASNEGPNVDEEMGPMDAPTEGEVPLPGTRNDDPENVKFVYRASIWSKEHSTFEPKPREFLGESSRTVDHYFDVLTFMHLFRKFWLWDLIKQIRDETNRYAGSLDENGRSHGHDGWYPTSVKELQVYFSISFYMGMKRLPNVKAYWAKSEPFFYYGVIGGLLTRKRYLALTRCLHITNPETYEVLAGPPNYDKMHQTRWLVDRIREACKREWKLGQFLTIDETMVRYKGTYCPKKLEKWGIKVWCLTDSITRYIADFDIYYGKAISSLENPRPSCAEASLAHTVVMDLVRGLEDKNHVVTMDNYFSSVGLFRNLEWRGIYATSTVRANRIGLPPDLTNTKEFKKRAQGELDWAMHESRKMCSVIWKDKQLVLLLSTHAPPITHGNPRDCTVPRRNGATRPDIPTSPVLKEYTKNMRGVDVGNHLRGNYTSLTRTHKWWHRVFHFFLDLTTVNMYIMYLDILKQLGKSHEALIHL
jgi:hypothetical protein